jgi:N-methylhydantoinase B
VKNELTDAVIDPFTTEVVRGALVSITDEMKTNLKMTAYNAIIYEAEDFTVGLFDSNGDTISIGLGLPMFIRGLSDAVKAKLRHWGPDGIDPGDVLLTNMPDVMGSHLNHMILTVPIFWENELVAFSSSMAHWQDVGGQLGGMTRDLFAEGLQVPFVKVFKKGAQDEELVSMIMANCRRPKLAMGDLRAQLAAIKTGERRVSDLLAKYGAQVFAASVSEIFAESERAARAAVSTIADGSYAAEAFMDDDGVNEGVPVRIGAVVHILGDEMTIDFSNCSPQVAGAFNSGASAGRSAADVAFKFITTPTLLPINAGSFRPLKVVLPDGLVVSATKPAPVRHWMTVPMTVVDTVFRALAPACPDKVIAGHHADLASVRLFARDEEAGTVRAVSGLLPGGGWGAVSDRDGESATVCLNDGDTHNTPVEACESKAPVMFMRRALRDNSGGAGKFRGGLGTVQELKLTCPATVNSSMERTVLPPWGLLGGCDAMANNVRIVRASGEIVSFRTGKIPSWSLEAGDSVLSETGGGGGFWDPLKRDLDAVVEDVRAGYVSKDAALRDYGVVILGEGLRVRADRDATADARSRRAERRAFG